MICFFPLAFSTTVTPAALCTAHVVFVVLSVCQVEAEEGAESVQLPFKTTQNLPEDAEVEWKNGFYRKVHIYRNGSDQGQNQRYSGRTSMRPDALDSGDFSLTLKNLQLTDSGKYTCQRCRYRSEVIFLCFCTEPFPSWAKAVLVLLFLLVLLVVSGGLIYYFRQYFMSGECLLLHYP
uniref:Ig-like domain-containing protein n=1 Tax=Maylandia zebra TaxID=106582 RepID=A0A3P9B7V1_9CICH